MVHSRSTVAELNECLQKIIDEVAERFPNPTDRPYIHPNVVRFPDSAGRANWRDTLGDEECLPAADYNEFFKRPKGLPDGVKRGDMPVWCGLVSSWSRSWVPAASLSREDRQKKWLELWHAWVFVVVKLPRGEGGGKHLLIWDCDADMSKLEGEEAARARDVLRVSTQRSLVDHIRHGKEFTLKDVWIGTTEGTGGKDRCMRESANWLREFALADGAGSSWRGTADDENAPDERFQGFRRIPSI